MTDLEAKLNSIHFTVSRRFIERHDNGEHWQMPPKNYDGSQLLRDDCDGFCLACRTLLRKIGIASRLVYCTVKSGGHLVVEVQGWILDNRQDHVVANTALKQYHWRRISGYEAGEPWREIVGLG